MVQESNKTTRKYSFFTYTNLSAFMYDMTIACTELDRNLVQPERIYSVKLYTYLARSKKQLSSFAMRLAQPLRVLAEVPVSGAALAQ